MNNRLKVFVRVKPIYDETPIIDIVDDRTLVFDPRDNETPASDIYFYHGRKFKSIGTKRKKNTPYVFDRVFNTSSNNQQIFETVTEPMVDATINGYNCSVFAYGATGSGKTFTMLGKPHERGVIYYTTRDLFEKLAEVSEKDPLPAELKICYFEIYNEKIRDLLVFEQNNFIKCGNYKRLRTTPERCKPKPAGDAINLQVCEAPDGSFVIADLSFHRPENADHLIKLIEAGNANRSQHPTDANADSSRSHAIFQIILTRRLRRINGDNLGSEYELQHSKMSLIDLAGSERASIAYRAGNERSKNLQREGHNINTSLLTLGKCINALAVSKCHIPYRESVLTKLLKDSLGGKCRTAMIATVCQQRSHYDDTQNTLNYASRAKCIKTRFDRNATSVAIQPRNYSIIIENQTKQITALQVENEQLKAQLEQLKKEKPVTKVTSNFLETSCFGPKLATLFDERKAIKFEILQYEKKYLMNKLQQTFKHLDESRQQSIQNNLPTLNGNSTFLVSNSESNALKTQLKFCEQTRSNLLSRADSNEEQIENVISKMSTEFVMRGFGSREDFDDLISTYTIEKERNQEIEEKKISEQYAYDLAQKGFTRLIAAENLLDEAANVVKYTHAITKGRGLSEALETKLSNLLKKLEGKKQLAWKDEKYELENSKANEPLAHLFSVHDNYSLNFLTPYRNNNTLHSRRLSKNLVSLSTYTPEQSNTTFDASH